MIMVFMFPLKCPQPVGRDCSLLFWSYLGLQQNSAYFISIILEDKALLVGTDGVETASKRPLASVFSWASLSLWKVGDS